MKKSLIYLAIVILSMTSCTKDNYKIPIGSDAVPIEPNKVEVTKNAEGKWQLLVSGKKYYINGAACNNYYTKVSRFGGNTIRLYSCGGEGVKDSLDQAYQAGLMVSLGISFKRERDGFDYNNEAKVLEQKETIKTWIKQFKDHPAVLLWSIGNEVDSEYKNDKVWTAMNDVAKMIHEMDPNHPTTTALASPSLDRVTKIKTMAPDIDILSINSYAPSLPALLGNLQAAGWEKPYMVTEFGPRGTWQMNAEPSRVLNWNDTEYSLVEETSTEKAAVYKDIWTQYIKANEANGCLGSFVFLWGYQKHGEVLGWYGLFNKEGYSFGAADIMQELWTEKKPASEAPKIASRNDVTMNGKVAEERIRVALNSDNTAKVTATTSAEVNLRYHWFIYKEGDKLADGSMPAGIEGLIPVNNKNEISFKAPGAKGAYRLNVYVLDDVNKKAASAVIPFYVE